MKVEVDQRYIWEENIGGGSIIINRGIVAITGNSIVISWDSGRLITYSKTMFSELLNENPPRLKIDKEYYRNKKIEDLGL